MRRRFKKPIICKTGYGELCEFLRYETSYLPNGTQLRRGVVRLVDGSEQTLPIKMIRGDLPPPHYRRGPSLKVPLAILALILASLLVVWSAAHIADRFMQNAQPTIH